VRTASRPDLRGETPKVLLAHLGEEGCHGLIMIEASPSAYPSGMLAVGKARFTKEGGDLRRFYRARR
jgi:hypothetical protein